jgi:hypothetical protein
MTRPTAFLLRFIALAPLTVAAWGCKAFDLGPETPAARAANEAVPGYPRLVDVPPEPVDVECVRAAIAGSLIAADTESEPEPPEDSPFVADRPGPFDVMGDTAGGAPRGDVIYQVVVPGSPAPAAPNRSVASVLSGLADDAMGGDEAESDEETEIAAAPPSVVDCPPGPGIEAERLIAERTRLEQEAAAIRSQRPAPVNNTVVLPEGMTRPAPAGEGAEQ